MEIKILHMYADLMNLYGEYGNIKILKHRLEDIGAKVKIDKFSVDDSEVNFDDYDFLYMGAGTEKNQLVALNDMKRYTQSLKKYIDDGKYALFTGNSFEILGKKIDEEDALGILNFEVNRLNDRKTSDVIFRSKYLKKEVVGFINKMANVIHNQNPLFEVEFGIGENEQNDYEGIKYKNLFGTYVIGPILVRNPEFLKVIMLGICESKDKNFKCKIKSYPNEEKGYALVLSELMQRKSSEER